MATKPRIGLRCYNPYVPNEIWALFKKDLRKIVKEEFPEQSFSISEFYWQGFSTSEEYLKFVPKNEEEVEWGRLWSVLQRFAGVFGMKIVFVYRDKPAFQALQEDTLFERKESRYSLKSIKEWTIPELDDFIQHHSYEAVKAKYDETAL